MTTAPADPMTAAMDATKRPIDRTYFGEVVTVDAWFCVLEKGVGKRPWDSTRDGIDQRRTVIKLGIQPLRGQYLIEQECLHFEPEWIDHTMPSLKQVGVDLRALKGKYCQVRREPTGRQYQNKQGETRDRTAIVFQQLFGTRDACQAAADAFFAQRGIGQSAPLNGATGMPQADLPQDLGMPPEQQFALNSLPALLKASGNDTAKFVELIRQNPLINKYYPPEHPHVRALINASAPDADDGLPF